MLKAHLDPPCKQGLYVMDNLRRNSQMGPMDSSMTRSGILSHLKIPHVNYDKIPYFFFFFAPATLIWYYQSSTGRFGEDELSDATHGEEADEGWEADNEDVHQVLQVHLHVHQVLLHPLLLC